MSKSASTAAKAVAELCLGAESVRQARAGGSRRQLAKSAGIPASVLSDIEDASVLPSVQQLESLQRCLSGIDVEKFSEVQRLGYIPWIESIADALAREVELSIDQIAERIASTARDCATPIVKWRLMRELSRLEGSGNFMKLPSGAWSLAMQSGPIQRTTPRRWETHQITERYDPEHDALFHLECAPGCNEIILNRSHPYYGPLRDLLWSEDCSDLDPEELRARLESAALMMRGLLVSWAEYEDGEKVGSRREAVRVVRQAWGRAARRIAQSNDVEGSALHI